MSVNRLVSAETALLFLSWQQTTLSSAIPLAVNFLSACELREEYQETALIKTCQSKVNFQGFFQILARTRYNYYAVRVIDFYLMWYLLTNSQSSVPM